MGPRSGTAEGRDSSREQVPWRRQPKRAAALARTPVGRKLEIAIVGAGPYGLSVAAHLDAVAGCHVRIFGKPMSSWDSAMPAGMLLKSDGFASSLSAPDGQGTLARFCAARGIPYADKGLPIRLETFVAY